MGRLCTDVIRFDAVTGLMLLQITLDQIYANIHTITENCRHVNSAFFAFLWFNFCRPDCVHVSVCQF